MVFGPNKRSRRVQRSIFHKNRPDIVETSPEGLGNFSFFLRKMGHFWIPPALNVLIEGLDWKVKNCFEK